MLQALLHDKLGRWLENPAAIEDLVTSVVLGTANYFDDELAMLPFLRQARTLEGQSLAERLTDLTVTRVKFWPYWRAGPASNDRTTATVGGAQPDALIEFVDGLGKQHYLAVEAKLLNAKSSHPSSGNEITDQLGKYWVHLCRLAQSRSATPLGVLYITASATLPRDEFEATQQELREKTGKTAPLHWLSWRQFPDVVAADAPSMLRDCAKLLRSWKFEYIRMQPFAPPPLLPARWRFDANSGAGTSAN